MNTEKKNGSFIPVIITTIILIILFFLLLFFLYRKGYFSFENNTTTNCQNDIIDDKTDNKETDDSDNITNSNMTVEEVFEFWNKIKGNWAHIQFNDDICAGTSLEINTYVKFSKFNSDGIMTYGIVNFNKLSDKTIKINLISPVNLNNQMNGGISAFYSSITIDLGEANDNKMNVKSGNGSWVVYEYVGENKTIFNENTQYYYIDSGFSQDYYCNWYRKNH